MPGRALLPAADFRQASTHDPIPISAPGDCPSRCSSACCSASACRRTRNPSPSPLIASTARWFSTVSRPSIRASPCKRGNTVNGGRRPFSTGCPTAVCSSRRASVRRAKCIASPRRSACASSSLLATAPCSRPGRRIAAPGSSSSGRPRATRSSSTTRVRARRVRSRKATTSMAALSGRTTASALRSTEPIAPA